MAGIGFTMSLFISDLAFPDSGQLVDAAKLGILAASLVAGVVGWTILRGASSSRPRQQGRGNENRGEGAGMREDISTELTAEVLHISVLSVDTA